MGAGGGSQGGRGRGTIYVELFPESTCRIKHIAMLRQQLMIDPPGRPHSPVARSLPQRTDASTEFGQKIMRQIYDHG